MATARALTLESSASGSAVPARPSVGTDGERER